MSDKNEETTGQVIDIRPPASGNGSGIGAGIWQLFEQPFITVARTAAWTAARGRWPGFGRP